eukprot:SAG31_NODE_3307_length_4437_cov_10.156754_7_plen_123_part_00
MLSTIVPADGGGIMEAFGFNAPAPEPTYLSLKAVEVQHSNAVEKLSQVLLLQEKVKTRLANAKANPKTRKSHNLVFPLAKINEQEAEARRSVDHWKMMLDEATSSSDFRALYRPLQSRKDDL